MSLNVLFFCSYYIEILMQQYYGGSFVNIGLFHDESAFTEDQTDDAVNEVQAIVAEYERFAEEQVCGGSRLEHTLMAGVRLGK